MDKTKLKELLDNVYELEGLLTLAINRDDCPDDFIRLIRRKGKEIASKCGEADETVIAPNHSVNYDHQAVFEEYSIDQPEVAEEISETSKIYSDYSIQELKDEIIDKETDGLIETEIEKDQEAIPEKESENKPAKIEKREEPNEDENPRGRLVFSVNDRFRFKRALFANSDAEFNTTLAFVASMDNYEEAEDYFINELNMDPARQEVVEFLAVIKKYFG